MAKKKKRTALPRVTLLAYSRRDLLAFTEAVEKIQHLVGDLQTVAAQLPKPKPKKLPALGGTEAGRDMTTAPAAG